MKAIFWGLLLMGLFVACMVVESDQYDETLDGYFVLSELNGKVPGSGAYSMRDSPSLQINAAEMQLSGSTGCNSIHGKIKNLNEQAVVFGEIGATKMACPGNLEADFLAMLKKTNRYEFHNGRLILYQGQQPLAKFFERKVKTEAEEG